MTAPRPTLTGVDPNTGIPDLIHRLTDDSKRLVADEMRLAKLEMTENIHAGARGALWMTLAFGFGVVGLVAFTLLVATLIGQAARGHMWVGAMVVGVLELVAAFVLIRKGTAAFGRPSYSLEETRESLKDTTTWVAHQRAD